MSRREITEESFRKDVASHVVTVLRDDGLYRHLRCQKPGSWCMGFDIVTYPGTLCYSGDMGCFVFQRLADMFQFFGAKADGSTLPINPYYWAEKIQAACRDGVEEFDPEEFAKAVRSYIAADTPEEIREELEDLIAGAEEGEHRAMTAAHDYSNGKFYLADFGDHRCQRYTYRYLWCCYALVWAIREYDKQRNPGE